MAKGDRRIITATVGGEPITIIHEGDEVSLIRYTATGREQLYANDRIIKAKG